MALSQGRRAQLDGIIVSMSEQGATEAEANAIVSDFTRKFGDSAKKATVKKDDLKFFGKGSEGVVGANVLPKIGEFLGLGPLGEGLGLAARELTGGNKALQETAEREETINASVPRETLARLKREGKPLPGQLGTEIAPQLENITTDDITNKQVLASAASAGLLATGGTLTKGLQRGVAGLLPAATSTLGRFAVGATPKVFSGAVEGAAFSAANVGAQGGSNEDIASAAKIGGIVGGAIPLGIEVAKPILRVAGRAVAEVFGIGLGTGGKPIRRVAQAAEEGRAGFVGSKAGVKSGLRTPTTGEDILIDTKKGLEAMKRRRATQYSRELVPIAARIDDVPLDKLNREIPEILLDFGIEETTDGLSFKNSTIGKRADRKVIKEIIDDIQSLDDMSAISIDNLKQRISDVIDQVEPSSKSGALLTKINGKIIDTLNDSVPGYEKLTKGYAEVTEQIRDLTQSLSLKEGASKETAIKKLLSVLKSNNEFREQLLQQLEQQGGQELLDRIAGVALSGKAPKGLTGQFIIGGSVAGGNFPLAFATLLTFSPRVIGEAALLTGAATRAVTKAAPVAQRAVAPVIGGAVGEAKKPSFSDF